MKNLKFLTLYTVVLFVYSCGNKPLEIDTSAIEISEVKINRLEQDLFTIDTANIEKATDALEKKYNAFYGHFIARMINNGGIADSSYEFRIKQFITDKDMKTAYESCQKTYPTVDEMEAAFTDVFKHYKYYFPKKSTPKVVTMMSGFNQWNVVMDSTIAIGLEMYLGKSNQFYKMLALPQYKTNYMNKENAVPDAVRNWLMTEFSYNMDKSDFLSDITYIGKIMHLSDAVMPNVADTIKTQYTQLQMEYCIQNEFNIWSYFTAQKMLYTSDQTEIMKYTSDGPFTSAFSKNAPPRIAYWVGWQIVRQYMKNNPDITLEQLMNETDAQKILSKAKYKPGK